MVMVVVMILVMVIVMVMVLVNPKDPLQHCLEASSPSFEWGINPVFFSIVFFSIVFSRLISGQAWRPMLEQCFQRLFSTKRMILGILIKPIALKIYICSSSFICTSYRASYKKTKLCNIVVIWTHEFPFSRGETWMVNGHGDLLSFIERHQISEFRMRRISNHGQRQAGKG